MPGPLTEDVRITWGRTREYFSLDPKITYLNHGSFGAVPIPVQRAQQRLRDEMEANPVAFFTRGLTDRIADARGELAGFVGADPDNTALVANATTATAIVLASLRPEPGDEIVLTNHGYGAVDIAVRRLCRSTGAVARTVDLPLVPSDDEVVDAIVAATRPGRTRLVVIDQVTSPTARLFPVARLAEMLRERGVPLLVDGAHAAGMLPLDVSTIGADFWLGNLHKWAYAPRPTALLCVAPHLRSTIDPLVASWEYDAGFPVAVEFAGTLDYTPWLAAPTGLHVLRLLGADEVRRHNAALVASGQRVVGEALGCTEDDLPDPAWHAEPVSMRLVRLPRDVITDQQQVDALRRRLAADAGIEVAASVWQGQGLLRLSAQVYNRAEDYRLLAETLPAAFAGQR